MIITALKQKRFKYFRFSIYITFFTIFTTLFSGCAILSHKESREKRSLVDLISFLDKCGLKAEKIQPTRFEAILASDGCAMYIDGAKMEVYIYDISNPVQKRKLEKILTIYLKCYLYVR